MINASQRFLQIQSWESFHNDVTQVKQMCVKYLTYSEQFILSPRNETIIPTTCLGNWTVKNMRKATVACLRKQCSFVSPARFYSVRMILSSEERHQLAAKCAFFSSLCPHPPAYLGTSCAMCLPPTDPHRSPEFPNSQKELVPEVNPFLPFLIQGWRISFLSLEVFMGRS